MRFARPGVLAMAVSVALVVSCGTDDRPDGVGDVPAQRLGFTRHADAVEWASVSDWIPPGQGLQALVPFGDCALGLGTFRNGFRTVRANWLGEAGCTKLALNPGPEGGGPEGGGPARDGPPDSGGWSGGGLAGRHAVVMDDGSLVAVNDGGLQRRTANGAVEDLARLDLPDEGVPGEGGDIGHARAITRAGNRVVVGGGQTVADRTTALMWISDDGGRTLRPVRLPPASGSAPPSYVSFLLADGDHVLAAGGSTGFGHLQVWTSTDGATSWTGSVVPDLPESATVAAVLRAGGRWILAGGANETRRPFVITSVDGRRWTSAADGMGQGRVVAATVDRQGRAVLVGQLRDGGPSLESNKRATFCGIVWVGTDSGRWDRGELGCGEHPPAAVATLADGRILIAGNRDLWTRP